MNLLIFLLSLIVCYCLSVSHKHTFPKFKHIRDIFIFPALSAHYTPLPIPHFGYSSLLCSITRDFTWPLASCLSFPPSHYPPVPASFFLRNRSDHMTYSSSVNTNKYRVKSKLHPLHICKTPTYFSSSVSPFLFSALW